jgi:hypothetical protein
MITEAKTFPNGGFIYSKIVWEKISLSPDDKKLHKNRYRGDNYHYSVQLDINRNLMEKLFFNKGQQFGTSEFKIYCTDNNYIELIYENSKIRQIGVNSFEDKLTIDGACFKISILQVIKARKQKRKVNRHIVNNPYPIKIFNGGTCSPK